MAVQTAEARQAKQLDEQRDLQDRQIKAAQGDTRAIKMIQANRDPKSQIKEADKDHIHIAVVTRNHDVERKEYFPEARVLKIQPTIFPQMLANNAFAQYDEAKVIHDPRPNAPEVVELKPRPLVVKDAADNANVDAAFAAREQKLKEMEVRLDAKLAEMQRLSSIVETGGKQKQAPTQIKVTSPVSGVTETPKQEPAANTDLPPLP